MEPKGYELSSPGYKELLLIDKIFIENCKLKRRNINTAWIYYKKGLDSVPHAWIIKALETIVKFKLVFMNVWRTTLILNYTQRYITSKDIDIIAKCLIIDIIILPDNAPFTHATG